MKKKKIIMENLTSLADTASFDKRFWRKAGAGVRFVAAWQMIKEFYKIRGIHGYKLRLQKSIQNIKQA